MNPMPNTAWWMCIPPGVTLPGHHFTPARIVRTDSRIPRNPSTIPVKKQNRASRPVSMIRSSNQSAMPLSNGNPDRRRERSADLVPEGLAPGATPTPGT